MNKPDLQFFQSELVRISDWIQFADKKSSFLGVFYSGIFALLVSEKDHLVEGILCSSGTLLILHFVTIIEIIVLFSLGLFFLAMSFFPKIKNGFTSESFCFYGNIASKKFADFSEKFENMSEQDFKKDLTEQIYSNSIIADYKMKRVQDSTRCLILLIVSVAILLFIF